jgi:hypothetical protein
MAEALTAIATYKDNGEQLSFASEPKASLETESIGDNQQQLRRQDPLLERRPGPPDPPGDGGAGRGLGNGPHTLHPGAGHPARRYGPL